MVWGFGARGRGVGGITASGAVPPFNLGCQVRIRCFYICVECKGAAGVLQRQHPPGARVCFGFFFPRYFLDQLTSFLPTFIHAPIGAAAHLGVGSSHF